MTVEETALRQLLAALGGSQGRRALLLEILNISDALPDDDRGFFGMARLAVEHHSRHRIRMIPPGQQEPLLRN